jgi:F-type H+-transporting ATPase subunit delta
MPVTRFSKISLNYAQALLELAGDKVAQVGQELLELRQLIDENPTFGLYLADPAIGHVQRTQAMQRIFENKISPLLYNFLRVLNTHKRLGKLEEIIGAYDELLEEKLGKVEVDLTVAKPLSQEQLAAAQQQISKSLGKDAVMHTYVDESIIGGMIVRVGDQLIDASVRQQLRAMRKQLLAKAPQ